MGSGSYIVKLVILTAGSILMASSSYSQTRPIHSWDFQERNQRTLRGLAESYQVNTEGSVTYLSLKEGVPSGQMSMGQELPPTFSLSFWIRFPENTLTPESRLFWTADNALSFRIFNTSLVFVTRAPGRNGENVRDSWVIPLDGADFASYDILANGGWHQLLIQYNHRSGKKSLYIDGRQLESWNKTASHTGKLCGANGCDQSILFNHLQRTNQLFKGDLAQVSLYPQPLNRETIGVNFSAEARKFGRGRSLQTSTSGQAVTQRLDSREFAVQNVSAESQLLHFPKPRYLPGHTLRPNFNWVDPVYLSGFKITDDSPVRTAARMSRMQEELWTNWHYTLSISSNLGYKLHSGRNTEHIETLIALANKYPELPLGIITFWANVQPAKLGSSSSSPNIQSKSFDGDYYFRQQNGRFFDTKGKISATPQSFSPTSPASLWKEDGEFQKELLSPILAKLNRQVDYVNENGEVQPFPMEAEILMRDPSVLRDYQQSGFSSWEAYTSDWKTSMRQQYRDGYMDHPRLRNAHYSWYAIDGGPYHLDRFNWDYARKAMYQINGQYYSTPNFYVRTPDNWRKWRGPWRGWEWISISRKVEIAAGDRLFSPFVGAGWSKDPTDNVRPSQWLGLLKCLGVTGAEFYYTGVFNERNVSYFPIPENYVWQLTTPAYAQAITSRYEEILRNGDLLTDAEGQPIVEYDTGDPRILLTARKHATRPEYILAGTIQPNSNIQGNVPDEAIAEALIDGMNIQLPVRRQGSVYHLDVRDPSDPILRQLDAWHETGHPGHWDQGFRFEAEVSDYVQDCRYQTTGHSGFDFSAFRTVLIPDGEDPCSKYQFELNETTSLELDILVRSPQSSGTIHVMLGDQSLGQITVGRAADFQTITFKGKGLRSLRPGTYLLSLHYEGAHMEIDQLYLH